MKVLPGGVPLTAAIIESFAGTFISPRFDNPAPTPQFHRNAWALYCSDNPQVLCVAPRAHAKSTALSTVYILAEVLFRNSDYVILISSTEEFAAEQLGNIAEELHSNSDLVDAFGIEAFEMDSKTDITVRMTDGHRFRILCRGAEQRIRGRLWKGKRPNLIVMDDAEDDEQVENAERRQKFRRWFFRAAKQALGEDGKTRVHGTILHEDSFLSKLRRNRSWKHLYYKAHAGFDDFSNILWPAHWTEKRLRLRRQEFIDDGDSAGYAQEFLNDPRDDSESYLQREDFLPMTDYDYESHKIFCAAVDLAASQAQNANRTSITVGGKDIRNILSVVDERVGRWNSLEVIEQLFKVQEEFNPAVVWVESGQIWLTIAPMLYREMQLRDVRINIEAIVSSKDKGVRGRSYQRRMRAKQVRFDKRAPWYAAFEDENLRFTGVAKATLDDQFDSMALLSLGFDSFTHVEEEDLLSDEERDYEAEALAARRGGGRNARRGDGRSAATGY